MGNCGGWPVLVLSVGRLVVAVACGVVGERRILASCWDKAGGATATGVPWGLRSLFGILSNSIAAIGTVTLLKVALRSRTVDLV